MATRHTYATTDDLREYLAGTSYSSGWTSDSGSIKRILEAQSKRIDAYCRGGTFGPVTQTRHYDIGRGNLRFSPQYSIYGTPASSAGLQEKLLSVVPLDNWIVNTTTVTAYGATDRATSTVLTEGYNADFWLMPYNFNPKTVLSLNEDTTDSLDVGQQTLSILGQWGYTADTLSVTTSDAISSTTATSVSVTSASNLSSAQSILIDSEQLYITSISGNTLTVERGVNGTTAATHSGGATVYRYDYPELVSQACLDLSKLVYRDRDAGSVDIVGSSDLQMSRGSAELKSVLSTLDVFKVASTSNGVIF